MKIAVVGLGVIGTSMALALKAALRESSEVEIVGHDPDGERVKRARSLGALDKSHWNLPASCENADLVLLDLSLEEMETTLAAIGDYLKEGCVVLDTSPLKHAALEMAGRLLPAHVAFVGGHPVSQALARSAEPAAALMQGAVFYLVVSESASRETLAMASNVVEAVGARLHFIDAAEHDGLMAASAQLPLVCALELFSALQATAGARERIQAVGSELAAMGSMLVPGGLPAGASARALLANRENLLRWLDAYAAELAQVRVCVEAGDTPALERHLNAALETCATWLAGASAEEPTSGAAEPSSAWRSMFLGDGGASLRGALGRRRKGQSKGDR